MHAVFWDILTSRKIFAPPCLLIFKKFWTPSSYLAPPFIWQSRVVQINGVYSESAKVISGIPQGSVLGPLLFVVYINDLLDNINSTGLLFADDTKIFRKITSEDDAKLLQQDIALLEEWSKVK